MELSEKRLRPNRSRLERRVIVEETLKPGTSLARVARAHDINANQLFQWRKMIGPPSSTRIWIAAGVTDLRRGFLGLSAIVQTILEQNPFSGQVFVFRGRRGDLIKLLWFDGDGL